MESRHRAWPETASADRTARWFLGCRAIRVLDQPIAEPPWGWGNPPPKPEVPAPSQWTVKYGWTEATGWFVFAVPTGPVPTPSKKK